MDILITAFKKLQQEGKAEIKNGYPICDWEELINMMIKITNKIARYRLKCKWCGATYSVYDICDLCTTCNKPLREMDEEEYEYYSKQIKKEK